MLISHRHRFIFFRNPKTGSASVRSFLEPFGEVTPVANFLHRTPDEPFYPHMPPLEAKFAFEHLGWDFSAYRKFTLVRNPWARLVSLYQHIKSLQVMTPTFDVWLHRVRPDGIGGGGPPWERWRRFGTYSISAFAGDHDRCLMVDRVLRLEDIGTELKPYLAELGLPDVYERPIPHLNRREARPYVTYYEVASRDLVGELFADEIETYGYEFGA